MQTAKDCPIRDILRQIDTVLELLKVILKHCDECLAKKGEQDG